MSDGFPVTVGNPILPPGWYECEVDAVEVRTSKAGKPWLSLRWQIIEGAESGINFYNQPISLTSAAQWKFSELLLCLGWDEGDSVENEKELLGKMCCVHLVNNEHKGKVSNQGDEWRPSNAPKPEFEVNKIEMENEKDDDLPF